MGITIIGGRRGTDDRPLLIFRSNVGSNIHCLYQYGEAIGTSVLDGSSVSIDLLSHYGTSRYSVQPSAGSIGGLLVNSVGHVHVTRLESVSSDLAIARVAAVTVRGNSDVSIGRTDDKHVNSATAEKLPQPYVFFEDYEIGVVLMTLPSFNATLINKRAL